VRGRGGRRRERGGREEGGLFLLGLEEAARVGRF